MMLEVKEKLLSAKSFQKCTTADNEAKIIEQCILTFFNLSTPFGHT